MEADIDCEFVDLIHKISSYFANLKCPRDMCLVECWISRLSNEKEKDRRNEYSRHLLKLLKSGNLKYPFTQQPPSGRFPQYKDIVNPRFNPYAPQKKVTFNEAENKEIWLSPDIEVFDDPMNVNYTECYSPRTNNYNQYDLEKPIIQCPPCPPNCEPIDVCEEEQLLSAIPVDEECCLDKQDNCKEIDKMMDAVCQSTRLQEFAAQIARFTCDKGEIMFKVISKETNAFRDVLSTLYENRNKDILESLNNEQKRAKVTYENWEGSILAKTRADMEVIFNIIPDFRWDHFDADDNYLWKKIYKRMEKEYGDCQKEMLPDINRKAMVQRKTWLTGIAKDIQEDNAERRSELTKLSKLLTSLTISYACSENKLSEQIAKMECEAKFLKNRIIENQKMIDALVTQVQTVRK